MKLLRQKVLVFAVTAIAIGCTVQAKSTTKQGIIGDASSKIASAGNQAVIKSQGLNLNRYEFHGIGPCSAGPNEEKGRKTKQRDLQVTMDSRPHLQPDTQLPYVLPVRRME